MRRPLFRNLLILLALGSFPISAFAWGEKGHEPGQFKFGPHGCWIDGEDSLYIGEVGGNEGLQKFRRV